MPQATEERRTAVNGSSALHRQADALRAQADALDALAQQLEAPEPNAGPPVADLTVSDIAEAHGKAESTVRAWLHAVPGAYRLGNELRVSRRAWRAYLDRLAGEDPGLEDEEGADDRPGGDLGAWREEYREAS